MNIHPKFGTHARILVLGTVVLVFGGALWFAATRRQHDSLATAAPAANAKANPLVTQSGNAALSWSDRIKMATVDDFRSLMAEAMQISDEQLRAKIIAELVTTWLNKDPKSFAKYFAGVEVFATTDGTSLRLLMAGLKEALTKLTPEAARSDDLMRIIERFVIHLAKEDPAEALRWAKLWLLNDTLDSAMVSVAREFAKRSPEQGNAIIAEVKAPLRRIQALSAVGGVWGSVDPERALAWADELTSPTERALTLNSVLLSVAQRDPALAASRLSGAEQRLAQEFDAKRRSDLAAMNLTEADFANDPNLYKEMANAGSIPPSRSPDIELLAEAARVIATNMAATDPAGAADWAESLYHEFLKMQTVKGVAAGLAKTDPQKAVAYALQNYPGFDDVLTAVYHNWASVSPEAAAQGLRLIDDPSKRKLAAEVVVNNWVAAGDAGRVAAWVDQLPAAERSDAIQLSLVSALSVTAPEESWARAQAIADPKLRYRAMKTAFTVLAAEQPDVARKVLASTTLSSRDAERLQELLAAVGANK